MKQLVKKLLMSLLTLGLFLLLLEIVVRLTVSPPGPANLTPVPADIRTPSTLPDVRFMLRPNAEVVHEFGTDPRGYFDAGATLTYRTNSLGFRGPATTREKPPGTFRILILGDSFTFGTGVRYDDTFTAVLQRMLNERGGETDFEVLNLGVMGYDTTSEVSVLRHVGLTYEPDAVVICFFLNDGVRVATHALFNSPDEDGPQQWRGRSRLLDIVLTRLARSKGARSLMKTYREGYEDDAAGWIRARRALADARVLSKQHEFELGLMIFPVLWKLSDYPLADVHDIIRSFAEELPVPVLDLHPEFSDFNGPELWVHPNNQHPNERAHAVAGEALYNFLITTSFEVAEAP